MKKNAHKCDCDCVLCKVDKALDSVDENDPLYGEKLSAMAELIVYIAQSKAFAAVIMRPEDGGASSKAFYAGELPPDATFKMLSMGTLQIGKAIGHAYSIEVLAEFFKHQTESTQSAKTVH